MQACDNGMNDKRWNDVIDRRADTKSAIQKKSVGKLMPRRDSVCAPAAQVLHFSCSRSKSKPSRYHSKCERMLRCYAGDWPDATDEIEDGETLRCIDDLRTSRVCCKH